VWNKTEIGLADWIRVLKHFPDATSNDVENMRKCLNQDTDLSLCHSLSQSKGSWRHDYSDTPRNEERKIAPIANEPVAPPAPQPVIDEPADGPLPIRIEKNNDFAREVTSELDFSQSTDAPLQLSTIKQQSRHRASLFPKLTVRGIISALVSLPVKGRDLDVEKLVGSAIRLEIIREIPLVPMLSSQIPCDLLVDYSDHLAPMYDDMKDLSHQFHSVLGETSCAIFPFTQDPLTASRWTIKEKEKWYMSPEKIAVIATDFGHLNVNRSEAAITLEMWKDFGLLCKKRRAKVVILTPLTKRSCPKPLQQMFTIVEWSPGLSSSDIKHLSTSMQKEL